MHQVKDTHSTPKNELESTPAIDLRTLAVVGDQRTCALITQAGEVVWYCPTKFDNPSLFGKLIGGEAAGAWYFSAPDMVFQSRKYLGESALLESTYAIDGASFCVRDWMPFMEEPVFGLIREFFAPPQDLTVMLRAAPDYGRAEPDFQEYDDYVRIGDVGYFYASHPWHIHGDCITVTIPKGENGYTLLMDTMLIDALKNKIGTWYKHSLERWEDLASHIHFEGPYQELVKDSIRAIRLMSYAPTGGIIAAATTSLPEVPGGERNYDYRYVWLRDAGMIVSALIWAGSEGTEERRYLSYICDTAHQVPNYYLKPLFSVSQTEVPGETYLDWPGYLGSRPVRVGNDANDQLQLDSLGNVLLAAELIFDAYDTREHWAICEQIADFLCENWQEADHGLWEETQQHHYTCGKVLVAVTLEAMTKYQEDPAKQEKWRQTARQVREYIDTHCLTSDGAYAVYAGSEDVDISAALFPVWSYTEALADPMVKTMERIEQDYCRENLYWRHLVDVDSAQEGAFLASTFWVAQYYVRAQKYPKAEAIIEAALQYTTDLGFFAEEVDLDHRRMMGNIPQSFVHAAFIDAVVDLRNAYAKESLESPN
ncbi:glycoside hydrolase family 15 protein [Rhabdobacter roseus]|uniref:GH15 family glucan-1,4-alpha-glucosidase n=1 Tax=Rhabdobacter roseus TaxID=1655419 RepID=A0A840TU97_9BACT|nr:glycoside hydrolase family 15 protein [Rhabdobacter roseus]MBB5283570.1 GH15 family glucan-1,4-alpha-glucosidase [Rhabdobacter roseus]